MRKTALLCCIGLLISGTVSAAAAVLPRTKPEKVGMSSRHLDRLDLIVGDAVEAGDPPGAVVLIGRRGKIVYRKAFGLAQKVPHPVAMRIDMVFDLASLTKPVATATCIMQLVERGLLRLGDKVTDYVPEFLPYIDEEGEPVPDASLRHLLTHTSGLPPYLPDEEVAEKLENPCSTEELVRHIARQEKISSPGEEFHYSCLGYITLAHILQRITGMSLAEFAVENVYRPLRMRRTGFKPGPELIPFCVPTEQIDDRLLRGVVHDPLARIQGGISGNAGLFSTADDLSLFACMLLNSGELGRRRILSPLTVERMTEICPELRFAGRGFGWDLDSPFSSNGGDLFGPDAFGHTGYTGTSIWIDPETSVFVIFLTNRVHPDDSGSVTALRGRVANIAAAAIVKIEPGSPRAGTG